MAECTRIQINPNKTQRIPMKPGIYRFYDENDNLLYIGASSNLFKRINQHFVNLTKSDKKQSSIRQLSKYIEYECYSTIKRAFEVERIEIWSHKPPLNRRGVINESFSYLIFRNNPFPQIFCYSRGKSRRIRENDEFYKINTSKHNLIRLLQCIRKEIPFCMASSLISCWDHQIGLCNNSCRPEKQKQENRKLSAIIKLLNSISGKNDYLMRGLEDNLSSSIKNLKFEHARKVSSAINSINILKLRFCGKGYLRDIDQFIFQDRIENISNKNQI